LRVLVLVHWCEACSRARPATRAVHFGDRLAENSSRWFSVPAVGGRAVPLARCTPKADSACWLMLAWASTPTAGSVLEPGAAGQAVLNLLRLIGHAPGHQQAESVVDVQLRLCAATRKTQARREGQHRAAIRSPGCCRSKVVADQHGRSEAGPQQVGRAALPPGRRHTHHHDQPCQRLSSDAHRPPLGHTRSRSHSHSRSHPHSRIHSRRTRRRASG
jgi:hypothetical protein